ncbi:MAG: methyltransferase domain-containing protein [Saccharospirillum sp.]
MSGFSIDWLDLREPADHRARDRALLERALQWLADRSGNPDPSLVADLGAGTGSTLRALSTAMPSRLSWRLVDHDPTLLAEAKRRHGDAHRLETVCTDLTHAQNWPLEGARLVTASALLDLVSEGFVESLAHRLQRQGQAAPVGVYAALNYDGSTQWTPAHPLDQTVLDAFNRDQQRDKGFGPALGPAAAPRARQQFEAAGFSLHTAPSPWVLGCDDQPLVAALIDGIAGAVAGSPGIEPSALEDWRRFRQSQRATGTCVVGHTDVLALSG